jgi:uncharacterized protein (DUF2249 family)
MNDDVLTPDSVVIDPRALPRGTCRDTILAAVSELEVGASLLIVNDHDIQPMKMVLATSWPGRHAFSYLEDGPDVWRIRITRTC